SRNLQGGHGGHVAAAQHPDLGISQAELRLPHWQQDIEQIGVTVVDGVSACRHNEGAPLRRGRSRYTQLIDDGHTMLPELVWAFQPSLDAIWSWASRFETPSHHPYGPVPHQQGI